MLPILRNKQACQTKVKQNMWEWASVQQHNVKCSDRDLVTIHSLGVLLTFSCSVQFSSVQSLSRVWLFATPLNGSTPGLPVHHKLPEFTQTHAHQVGDAIQPSHPLSSPSPPAPKSLPASGYFPMSQLFTSGGQSIGVSASASVLPMNTQDWSPSGWTGWISLQSKGLSRVFSNITVQKHQFFGT